MKSKLLVLAVLFVTYTELHASKRHPSDQGNVGGCSDSPVKEDFDPSRFHGTWYEIFAYPFELTAGGRCVSFTFSQEVDDEFKLLSKCMKNGMLSQVMGLGSLVAPGVMSVIFPAYRELFIKTERRI